MFGRTITKGFQEGLKSAKTHIRKRYLPKTYIFNSIAVSDPSNYLQLPPRQGQVKLYGHKEEEQQSAILNYVYLGLFIAGFYISDYLYSLSHNSKQSYRLHLFYPNYTHIINHTLNRQDVRPWVDIAKAVWVKDFVEFRAFWDRVGTQLWARRRKQREDDQDAKAGRLKKQYAQFNQKYPAPNKQSQNLY